MSERTELLNAARHYVQSYLLDEYKDARLCCCGADQHKALTALFDAIKDAEQAAPRAEEGVQEWISVVDIEAEIAHIRQNGISLAKFGGQSVDEGRCRELCAMYLDEFIRSKRVKDQLAKFAGDREDNPRAENWNPYGNAGMRHMEESDVRGGQTDCKPLSVEDKRDAERLVVVSGSISWPPSTPAKLSGAEPDAVEQIAALQHDNARLVQTNADLATELERARSEARLLFDEAAQVYRRGMLKAARMCGSFIRPNGPHTQEYATACADLQDAIRAAAEQNSTGET